MDHFDSVEKVIKIDRQTFAVVSAKPNNLWHLFPVSKADEKKTLSFIVDPEKNPFKGPKAPKVKFVAPIDAPVKPKVQPKTLVKAQWEHRLDDLEEQIIAALPHLDQSQLFTIQCGLDFLRM